MTAELLSISEYLLSEEKSQTKNEYVAGRLIAMAGNTRAHGEIQMNLIALLIGFLKDTPCKVLSPETKVRPEKFRSYRYPDVMVACDPSFADEKLATVLNPKVIFEVTSDSTQHNDHYNKLTEYASIDSMRQYVIVSQQSAGALIYQRQDVEHPWMLKFAAGLEESIDIPSLKLSIPMRDVYAGVELPPVELPATSA